MVPEGAGPGGIKIPARQSTQVTDETGMTLRDYFAGQALSGMFNGAYAWSDNSPDTIAENAYIIADAMLSARQGGAK